MMNGMTYVILSILLAHMVLAQKVLIKTKHKKYLASMTQGSKSIKKNKPGTGYGNDYDGGTCNLKQRGAQKQHYVSLWLWR